MHDPMASIQDARSPTVSARNDKSEEPQMQIDDDMTWDEPEAEQANVCCLTINLLEERRDALAEQTEGMWKSHLSSWMEIDESLLRSVLLERMSLKVEMVASAEFLFHRPLLKLINRMFSRDLPESDLLKAVVNFSVDALPSIHHVYRLIDTHHAQTRRKKLWVYVSLNPENKQTFLGNEFLERHLIPAISCKFPLVDIIFCNPRCEGEERGKVEDLYRILDPLLFSVADGDDAIPIFLALRADHYGWIPNQTQNGMEEPFSVLFSEEISVQEAELRCALATWGRRATFLGVYCCEHERTSLSEFAVLQSKLLERERARYQKFLHAQRLLCVCDLSEEEKASLFVQAVIDELKVPLSFSPSLFALSMPFPPPCAAFALSRG
eukprot:760818-Hanusia_phi.AAC.4